MVNAVIFFDLGYSLGPIVMYCCFAFLEAISWCWWRRHKNIPLADNMAQQTSYIGKGVCAIEMNPVATVAAGICDDELCPSDMAASQTKSCDAHPEPPRPRVMRASQRAETAREPLAMTTPGQRKPDREPEQDHAASNGSDLSSNKDKNVNVIVL